MNKVKSKDLKPIKRSRFRIALGKQYYTLQRYRQWFLTDKKYAGKKGQKLLDCTVFTHKTLLMRKLKDVDMWMQHNKVINLGIAIQNIDDIVVYPGETFSYWKLIGKPTKGKGYAPGMMLHYGKFEAGIGGGLCQLSNLIYWMTLHTPLTVTERHRHSYDVFPDSNRTQPFGSGATCLYNYRDLQIYNGTDQPYQLHLYMTEDDLAGEWRTVRDTPYSYEVYEKEHVISHEYWGGYVRHNLICRKKYDLEGNIVEDEYITENHALMMYQPFIPANTESEDFS